MLDPFSHLLLVINSALNIIFYGIFNKKFREVSKKEFVRCFPKTAARLSPSKSKPVPVSNKQNQKENNHNSKTRLPVTETAITQLSRVSSRRNDCDELVPLNTLTTELPVNSSAYSTKSGSDTKEPISQSTIPGPIVSSSTSIVNSNNKQLMDSSTQIPNSEFTTNLKRIPTKEKRNNDNNGSIGETVLSKGNSIICTSPISKKESVNEECMNIEAGTKFAKTTDIDGIAKFSDTSLQCNEKDGDNKNIISKKVITFL